MRDAILMGMMALTLCAEPLVLTPQQEALAGIKTQSVSAEPMRFIGEATGSVEVPVGLLHTVSIPFEVKVLRLLQRQYDEVAQGEVLAEVTGGDFLNAQQQLINRFIEREQSAREHERKSALCQEGVIAAKECLYSHSALQSAQAQFASAKGSLLLFGVDEAFVEEILRTQMIQSRLSVRAPVSGVLKGIHVHLGQSVSALEPLFTVMQKGALWLSAQLERKMAERLKVGEAVWLEHDGRVHSAKVLSIAPFVDAATQTIEVRFDLGTQSGLRPGLKAPFRVSIAQRSVRIPKSQTVLFGAQSFVYLKTPQGYTPYALHVLSEDDEAYYCSDVQLESALIVSEGVAALKGAMND